MEFNVKIHCEINVKLVFHEILWKKNFTVYPSLKKNFNGLDDTIKLFLKKEIGDMELQEGKSEQNVFKSEI